MPPSPFEQANLPLEDDVLDLRQYVEVLVRGWKAIAGVALVAAVVAWLSAYIEPRTYTAEADIALLNLRSEIIFDETYKTLPAEDAGVKSGQSRQDALKALALSPSLLAQVFEQVAPEIEGPEANPQALKQAADVETTGDLLHLKVTWADPEDAATIANAWARLFTSLANKSYVNTGDTTPEEARAAADSAFARYRTAQVELERFIADSDAEKLRREITETEALIAGLQAEKTNAISLTNSIAIVAANQLAEATRAALLKEMNASVRRAYEDRARQLDDWYQRKAILERLAQQLEDLRLQIESGNVSAAAASGDALAVMFARSGLAEESERLPGLLLQLDVAALAQSGENLAISDVEALSRIVADGLAEAEREIARLSQELFDGVGVDVAPAVPEDHQLIRRIQAQVDAALGAETLLDADAEQLASKSVSQTLEQLADRRQRLLAQATSLQARERELTRSRDAAWELYTTLDNKANEVAAQFATGAPQVRMVVEAIPPAGPNPRGGLVRAFLAASLGAAVTTLFVFAAEYWHSAATAVAPVSGKQKPVAGD